MMYLLRFINESDHPFHIANQRNKFATEVYSVNVTGVEVG